MITLSVPVRNSRLAAIANALDAAPAAGLLRLYTVSRPAVGEALTDSVLLVEFRLAKPCVATLDAGVLTFPPVPEALCLHSGTPAWARLSDGDGRWVMDMDVGLPGSGAEVALSSLQLFAGGVASVVLAEISE